MNPEANNPHGSAVAGTSEPSLDADLDAYIDGRLSGQRLQDFERRLESEPRLRAELQAHRELEGALRTAFSVPLARSGAAPAAARAPKPWLRLPLVRVAAAVVVATLLGVLALSVLGPEARHRPDVLLAVYRTTVERGFKPEVVCTTNEEFAGWTKHAFGVALTPAALPASIELLGWSRAPVFSSYTGVLLARVDGREVVVLIDRRDMVAGRLALLRGPELQVFSAQVGPLALHEVTPLGHPSIANLLAIVPSP